jgi:hypothetical protein
MVDEYFRLNKAPAKFRTLDYVRLMVDHLAEALTHC